MTAKIEVSVSAILARRAYHLSLVTVSHSSVFVYCSQQIVNLPFPEFPRSFSHNPHITAQRGKISRTVVVKLGTIHPKPHRHWAHSAPALSAYGVTDGSLCGSPAEDRRAVLEGWRCLARLAGHWACWKSRKTNCFPAGSRLAPCGFALALLAAIVGLCPAS